mgnify:CR=1 FL=1
MNFKNFLEHTKKTENNKQKEDEQQSYQKIINDDLSQKKIDYLLNVF